MAKIILTLNNQPLDRSERTLEAFKVLLTTRYPTEGIASVCVEGGKGNGDSFVAALQAGGRPEDVYEVTYETDKTIQTGKSTRANLANLCQIALHPETWMNILPKSDSAPKSKGGIEI